MGVKDLQSTGGGALLRLPLDVEVLGIVRVVLVVEQRASLSSVVDSGCASCAAKLVWRLAALLARVPSTGRFSRASTLPRTGLTCRASRTSLASISDLHVAFLRLSTIKLDHASGSQQCRTPRIYQSRRR